MSHNKTLAVLVKALLKWQPP